MLTVAQWPDYNVEEFVDNMKEAADNFKESANLLKDHNLSILNDDLANTNLTTMFPNMTVETNNKHGLESVVIKCNFKNFLKVRIILNIYRCSRVGMNRCTANAK